MQSAPALLAPPLRSTLDPRTPEFAENRTAMLEQLAEIDRLLDEAEAGGGPAHHARLAERGKLPVRERIALALDPDSPFLEISPLAGYDSDYTIGGGTVVGIGVIAGVECVIIGNDPTVLGGALTPYARQEVDARDRDRPRQPHPVRAASSSRPAPTCAWTRPTTTASRSGARPRRSTSPRPAASSTR